MADRSKKQKWTHAEDASLIAAVQKLGTKSWKDIADFVPGRNGKQCRERWTGQLCPSISKDIWTPEEDTQLISAQQMHGNKWALIAKTLPGRSSIAVKNRWGWLQRHGLLDDVPHMNKQYSYKQQAQTCGTNNNGSLTDPESSEIVVPTKSKRYFTPLEVPDTGLFGAAFLAFQRTLFI